MEGEGRYVPFWIQAAGFIGIVYLVRIFLNLHPRYVICEFAANFEGRKSSFCKGNNMTISGEAFVSAAGAWVGPLIDDIGMTIYYVIAINLSDIMNL